MKKMSLLVVALMTAACASAPIRPVPPPVPPYVVGAVGITLTPPLPGVTFHVGETSCTPDDRGIAYCVPVIAGDYVLVVDGVDATQWKAGDPVAVHVVGSQNTEVVAAYTRVRPVVAVAGRFRRVGNHFVDASGQPWTWKFATEFLLLNDLLDGKDITPILDDPESGLVALGANGVRVIGMAHYIPLNERAQPDFAQARYGGRYFDELGALADLLRERGMYLEFTALADAQMLMPDAHAQRDFMVRVAEALASKDNVFLEHCNEPFKNGCGDEVAMGRVPGDVLQASGNYDVRPDGADRWVLDGTFDYVTTHPPRDDEWPRKARDAMDIRDGFFSEGRTFAGARVPVVLDEPIGAATVAVSGRRANDPSLFRTFGAAAAMFGAGATFHSDAGVATRPLAGPQLAAARAFFAGINAVPPAAQLWGYARGDQSNRSGVPFPIALYHDDAWALRTFVKRDGQREIVVVVGRTPAWRYQEQNGYHCTPLVADGDVFTCTQ